VERGNFLKGSAVSKIVEHWAEKYFQLVSVKRLAQQASLPKQHGT
jgi:hypothetical protein